MDTKNACYGGAQALLNAVDYVGNNFEVRGLKAIVVAADIAVYEAGPARCTGGSSLSHDSYYHSYSEEDLAT